MFRSDVEWDLLPNQAGVYVFKSQGNTILYIGKAKNLKKRLQQYFSPSSLWKQDMVSKAGGVERFPVENEQEALILETQMINHHLPPYNNLIKGNSSYVYIKIENHDFPRISTVRFKKRDKATYIGPKARRGDLKKFIHMVRYLFQRRSCTRSEFNKGMVCSDYYFGLCGGRCGYKTLEKNSTQKSGFSSPLTHQQAKIKSDESMKLLRAVFSGRIKQFQAYIKKQIDEAIDKENFERAVKLRDMHIYAETLVEKQSVVFTQDISGIYFAIQQYGKFNIRVVISIVQGRIVDIIGQHEYQIDISQEELIDQIKREYQIDELKQNHCEYISYYSLNKKNIAKKSLELLDDHAQRFLQGYTFSRFASEDPASRAEFLQQIVDDYQLSKLPKHIECVDISHFGGENTVAGLTAMHQGVLAKNSYKRYNITSDIQGGDDYGALKEVIEKRFGPKSNKKTYPDLFIIDGGVGQLGIIVTLCKNDKTFAKRVVGVQFASIGKGKARTRNEKLHGEGEIFHRLDSTGTISSAPILYKDSDRLLILVRDEAHRFANAFREKKSQAKYKK